MNPTEEALKAAQRYAPDRIISPNTTFADLHRHVDNQMLNALEKRLGIRITQKDAEGLRTVADLIALVRKSTG